MRNIGLDEKTTRTKPDKTDRTGQISEWLQCETAKRFLQHYRYELSKRKPGTKEYREFSELADLLECKYEAARERLEREHEQAPSLRSTTP